MPFNWRSKNRQKIASEMADFCHSGMLRVRLDPSDPFLVVSGYRSPTTNMNMYLHGDGVARHSYHTKGMAVDLRSEQRSLTQVRDAAMSLQCGGVGYYPRSGFVHVDCGPIRRWLR